MVEFEWGIDPDTGEFVHAKDAIPSKPYKCEAGCGTEIRRRAGSYEPHFFHLNPNKDGNGVNCDGGEGELHNWAKTLVEKFCRNEPFVINQKLECRIANFVVDVLIQTPLGPLYIEVINSKTRVKLPMYLFTTLLWFIILYSILISYYC